MKIHQQGAEDLPARTQATRAYENVYEHFIEGHFDEAAAEKLKLDSTYGDKYWTPQLLFIEALYYMHYRYDSIGKVTLNKIITKYQGTVMAAKAKNVLRVLNERERIENYLRNLNVSRLPEDSIARAANAIAETKKQDSVVAKPANKIIKDSGLVALKKPDSLQLRNRRCLCHHLPGRLINRRPWYWS